MQYELYEGLQESKRTKASASMSQIVKKIETQADTKAGRFLSSKSAWDRGSLGLRARSVRNSKFSVGTHPAILLSMLVLAVSKNKGAGVMGC